MSEGLLEQMMRLDKALHGPPKCNVLSAAIPQPVDPFPTSFYTDPFDVTSAAAQKLKKQLGDSVKKVGAKDPGGRFGNVLPMAFTIADVTSGTGPFPMGGYNDTVVDFIASLAKVAVMYTAYELRAMARRFAAKNLCIATDSDPSKIFSQMERLQNPQFKSVVPLLNSATTITDAERLGGCATTKTASAYSTVFTNTAGVIDFSDSFMNGPQAGQGLKGMVEDSDTDGAGDTIHGIGYSYLNGALQAGGFFTQASGGLWVSSDYGNLWKVARPVMSKNDGMATITGTTYHMAKLLALILTGTLVDKGITSTTGLNSAATWGKTSTGGVNGGAGSSAAMKGLLGSKHLPPFTFAAKLSQDKFTLNKVGFSSLKPKPDNTVHSQVSLIENPTGKNRNYIVAWQNLVTPPPGVFKVLDDKNIEKVTDIILGAIGDYEKTP
jgi:hypothetical protein